MRGGTFAYEPMIKQQNRSRVYIWKTKCWSLGSETVPIVAMSYVTVGRLSLFCLGCKSGRRRGLDENVTSALFFLRTGAQ